MKESQREYRVEFQTLEGDNYAGGWVTHTHTLKSKEAIAEWFAHRRGHGIHVVSMTPMDVIYHDPLCPGEIEELRLSGQKTLDEAARLRELGRLKMEQQSIQAKLDALRKPV